MIFDLTEDAGSDAIPAPVSRPPPGAEAAMQDALPFPFAEYSAPNVNEESEAPLTTPPAHWARRSMLGCRRRTNGPLHFGHLSDVR